MATPTEIRDLLVVLPGILGSTLAKNDKLVWAPSVGAVLSAIRTFGRSIKELMLPEGVGDNHPGDGVTAEDLMPDLHILPGLWTANIGYGALLDQLRTKYQVVEESPSEPGRIPNLLRVPYDWRLSNRYNGRQLKRKVEPALEQWRSQGGVFAEARLIFICHSMGGLVARWYIEKEGGAELTRKLITLGTPYRGALSSLDQLVNGVKKGIWPFKLDLTSFARSLPSTHQLLPEYACIEGREGLIKTTEVDVPELETKMVSDGMRFHDELNEAAQAHSPEDYLHPMVGTRQRTGTTARLDGRRVKVIDTYEGQDRGGDATVPRLSATPGEVKPDSPIIRWPAEKHGSLQSNKAVLDELDGILTAEPSVHRGSAGKELRVDMEELLVLGEPLEITAEPEERMRLQATVTDERGKRVIQIPLEPSEDVHRGIIEDLAPGAYQVVVGGVGPKAPLVADVTSSVLVWDEAAM
ncbi:MAG: lipase/acyltransferase domain-containing protein [Actinomycetota bacterium]